MKWLENALVFTGGMAGLLAFPSYSEAQVYPERGLFDQSTGLVTSRFSSGNFRGSGVIARDPRLVYSCAHVLYEDGVWATSYKFHRAYHAQSSPASTDGASPRGFRYFTQYEPNLSQYGDNSYEAFSVDFVVYYADSSFGDAVGYWLDGGNVLRSNRWKRIVGYPSYLHYNGQQGYCYQHATDWFSNEAVQWKEAYHRFTGVSTGPGNSGGPLFVHDSVNDQEYLAGIVVSGLSDSVGTCALSDATHKMATNALGLEPVTRTFTNSKRLRLPDGSKRYKNRSITADGYSEGVTGLTLNARINTRHRGELAVYLKSPSGRIHWVSKPSKDRRKNLVVRDLDVSSSFDGVAANGRWVLRMRDARAGNPSVFRNFSVTLTAPATP